nr:AMP-binding protein [Micromonospora sp. DSM 115978]
MLHERGLRPGDGVALLAENHLRYFEVYWAAKRSGLYLTALNWHLSPDEIAYQVDDSKAKALVCTHRYAATAAKLAGLVSNVVVWLTMDGELDGFEVYEDVVAAMSTEPLAEQPRGEVMLYSSGTTGFPKGIRRPLTGRTVDDPEAAGTSIVEKMLLGMSGASVYLCPAPLYHAAGLQWSAGVHELGGTLVVMEKFDAEGMLAAVERFAVTHIQLVPTML